MILKKGITQSNINWTSPIKNQRKLTQYKREEKDLGPFHLTNN